MPLFDIASFQKPKPFLKWVGGKTQLIDKIDYFLSYYCSRYKNITYIEPFVGGGAILFHVLAKFPQIHNFVINDINENLINAYQLIREDYQQLVELLTEIEATYYNLKSIDSKQEFYLTKRDEFNQENKEYPLVKKTALLIFLNKTCFNGLYRVNKKGKFNVPFGKYKNPRICYQDNLISVHHHLEKVKILQGDFENTLNYANKPTIFYLDPPYKPINSTSAFTSYSSKNFDDQQQLRVKLFCDKINEKGHHFILSNSDVKKF